MYIEYILLFLISSVLHICIFVSQYSNQVLIQLYIHESCLEKSFLQRETIQGSIKDKLPLWATPICIYQFTYSCVLGCIGHTKRAFGKWISQNYPAWLSKIEQKLMESSLLEHMANSGRILRREPSIKILYKMRKNKIPYINSYKFHRTKLLDI